MKLELPVGPTLRIETRVPEGVTSGALVLVRLQRPESANALNTQMGHDLLALFEGVALHPEEVRCLILTGCGEKAFCAGGDLKERHGMSDAAWMAQHRVFELMMAAILACPVPVIAAVNGAAFGGGCEIAACCDFIYAAARASFALPETKLGIMPGGGGTQTLPRALGERRAKELILTGTRFTAQEALQWGFVNAVFGDGELLDRAIETATIIARNAPLSVSLAKQAIHRGLQVPLSEGLAHELDSYRRLIPLGDRQEGVRAFNERRPPKFRGR